MTYANETPNTLKLFAPYVPQASRHGIGISAAAHLQVCIDPYPDMDEGDLIELFWSDRYVTSKLISKSDIGHTIFLRVPESFLQSGKVRTYYRLMKVGGVPVTSPSKKLLLKLDAPGGHLIERNTEENQSLAPPILPLDVVLNGLDAQRLKRRIALIIEPYQNMAAQDEITVRWGDARMDLAPVTTEMIGFPVVVDVPPALIKEAGDDPQLEVSYCIIDRVGNHSYWAPCREIAVYNLGSACR